MFIDTWERFVALPKALVDVAASQHATFDLAQAKSCGATQDMLDVRVRTGEIESLHRSVYKVAGSPDTWEQRAIGAVLAGGPGTALSHGSAIRLWELADIDADAGIEITVPRGRSPRFGRGNVIIHRPLDLTPQQVARRRGIPVTNPLRTMVDFAGVADFDLAQEALDAGIARKLFTIVAVDRMRARLAKPGRTGSGKTRVLLDSQVIRDQNRSVLEARMARLWKQHHLPPYTFQHVVRRPDGTFVARPDFVIVVDKIVIEVDGWEDHSAPWKVDADGRRDHKLIALGWIVMHFSWWRIKNEPAQVAEEIRAAISARSAAS